MMEPYLSHPSSQASGLVGMRNSPVPHLNSHPHNSMFNSYSLAAAIAAQSHHHVLHVPSDMSYGISDIKSVGRKRGVRHDPVPQSGFKGVSWNSRMKAWLAFYVTESGERKSKTFSTRKLGMEEARIQAIQFCREKQDQRREARKKGRDVSSNVALIDKLGSDDSGIDSPQGYYDERSVDGPYQQTVGIGIQPHSITNDNNNMTTDVAYVPIVPIALDMIANTGLLQPLELTILPPCQHCNKQPYPFLMIVSEGQEYHLSNNFAHNSRNYNASPSGFNASNSPDSNINNISNSTSFVTTIPPRVAHECGNRSDSLAMAQSSQVLHPIVKPSCDIGIQDIRCKDPQVKDDDDML